MTSKKEVKVLRGRGTGEGRSGCLGGRRGQSRECCGKEVWRNRQRGRQVPN